MARADEMLLCANCQANVFVLTQEEEADRHRERERDEEKTDLALTDTTLSPTFLFSLTKIGP